MKYYEMDQLIAANAYWNIIFGGRSNGKSDAMARYIVDKYMEDGSQFGRAVRYYLDVNNDIMESYFCSNHLSKYIREKYERKVIFNGSHWYLIPWDIPDEKIYSKTIPREQLGTIFVTAAEYRYKSSQFDEIKTLINEEFSLMDIAGYCTSEFEKFLSLVSTINRGRKDLKVFLIGNTLNKANPYLEGLKINLEKLNILPGKLRTMYNSYGTKYAVDYAEMSYENEKEIPEILRIEGNEIAFVGDFERSSNVYNQKDMAAFMKKSSPFYAFSVLYHGTEYRVYKVRLTNKINGWACLKNWAPYGGSNTVIIDLSNRLIDIDPIHGATIGYLKEVGFDLRLCLFDNDLLAYAMRTAILAYR